MTPEQAKALREPFPPGQIGKLPRANTFLDYIGHASVTDRLLHVDPEWTWEPVAFDANGLPLISMVGKDPTLWIRLTVGGVTRLGVGTVNANAFEIPKQLISDALRNAAMRFGVGLDLWSKEDLASGYGNGESERGAAPAAAVPAGWASREEALSAHQSLRAQISMLGEIERAALDEWREANGLAGWPLPKDAFDALMMEAAKHEPLLPPERHEPPPTAPPAAPAPDPVVVPVPAPDPLTAAQTVPGPDEFEVGDAEAPIDGPAVFTGDSSFCGTCGGPIWYDGDRPGWEHADAPDDEIAHPGGVQPADGKIDVDALYALAHPTPEMTRARIAAEVGALSGSKLAKAITEAGLLVEGPPPTQRKMLVDFRISALAG